MIQVMFTGLDDFTRRLMNMGKDIYMPNCCYICLGGKPFMGFSTLSEKKVAFKSFENYTGDTISGNASYSIANWNLPICNSCKNKNIIYTIFMVILAFSLPILSVLGLSTIVNIFFDLSKEGTMGNKIMAIGAPVLLVLSIIFSVFIFKLRNSYGLMKSAFLSKDIKFKNLQFANLFFEVNKVKDYGYL